MMDIQDSPSFPCQLCGIDRATNKGYSHRKQWIVERLALLSNTFAIEVCAFAIMSNHTHSVLKINEHLAQIWSDEQVIQRWESHLSK